MMSFRRFAVLGASLFLAISCADDGGPTASEEPRAPQPGSPSGTVIQAFTCDVNVRAGTFDCRPASWEGNALAAVNIGSGGGYTTLTASNSVRTPTSHTFDVTIRNNMVGQPMGTQDGVTADSYGIRVFHYDASFPTLTQPRVTVKTDPALPASVVMNGDGSQVFAGAGSLSRPYFQYPAQILLTGETSTVKNWSFTLDNVTAFALVVFVSTEVPRPYGWLDIVPDAPVVEEQALDTLVAQVRGSFGQRVPDPLTWTSSDTTVVTVTEAGVDSLAQITGVGAGTAWVKAVSTVSNSTSAAARRDSVLVTVLPAGDSMSALSNVTAYLSADSLPPQTVTDTSYTTVAGGIATIGSDGTLSYLGPAGYAGKDTITYDISNGVWTVQGRVIVQVDASSYWYVQAGTDDPGTTEDNTGRDRYPFRTMAAAVAAAGTADSIFVLAPENGTDPVAGAATLKAGQAVLGEGISDDYSIVLNGITVTIFDGTGTAPGLTHSSGATLTLAATGRNQLRGFGIGNTGGTAISAPDFDSVYVRQVAVSATGPALNLTGGHLDAEFLTLSSSSTSTGISLLNATGLVNVLGSGSIGITGAGGAAVSVSGGVGLSFSGNITQDSNNPLLNVSGHSGGTLALSGTLAASHGSGLQFDNADGTYNLGTLSFTNSAGGADAGVDVLNTSSGTFTFGAGSSITNPAGNVFRITGSAPTFTYPGSFSKNSSGVGVHLQSNTGGSITFSGSTKGLTTGGSDAVFIQDNAAGVLFSGGGLALSTTTGRGFFTLNGGTVQVTGADNTINTTGAAAVSMQNTGTGASGISFRTVNGSGAANAIALSTVTGAGFQVTGSGTAGSGGTLSATGTAITISTADSTRFRRVAVNAPAAVGASSFGGLRLDSATITSTAGTALGLTTGRLHVSDVAVSSTGGAALNTTGVVLNGGLNNLSATTATGNAVALNNTTTGTLTVAAGTITMNVGAGAAIVASGAANTAAFTYSGSVTQNANAALLDVNSGHAGTLTFNTGTLTGANGSGLQFNNADGGYTFNGTTNLSNTTGGADAGIDVTNGSGGSFSFASTSTITNPAGEAIRVANSGPTFTYDGAISKTNGSTGITVTGSTGTITINSISGTVRTITSGTTNPAVNLTSNSGATISFGGGNLAITSDDGNAFNATGGGTVNVTGLTNTLSSTGGIALNVNATSIGASGLNFRSINANGGTNGIALNNVGTGALNVQGNGGVCTIATPTCSGGTIQNTTGDGVSLNTVQRVRLDLVRVLNTAGHGISGTATSGLTIANSLIQGAGDADNEAGIFFASVNGTNLTGTDSIISSVVHAPSDVGVHIHNYGGTLNLVVQGSTFSGTDIATPGVVTGDDLFRLVSDRTGAGSATITAKFTGSTFDQSESDGLAALAQSSTGSGGGTLNVTVDGNTFNGDNGGASCSSGCNDNGIVMWGTQGATLRFTVQNNNVQNQRNEAIGVRADNTSSVQGIIQSNTIGSLTSRSASYTAQAIFMNSDDNADLVVRVHNNTVGSTFWQGIWANAADGTGGSPKMDVTLTSNTTRTPVDNSGVYLPSIDVQGTTAAVVCAKVESNTAQPGQASAGSIDMLQFNTATFRIEGLPSPTNDASSYLAGKNPASSAPVYAFAAGSGSTFSNATCRTPAATPSL